MLDHQFGANCLSPSLLSPKIAVFTLLFLPFSSNLPYLFLLLLLTFVLSDYFYALGGIPDSTAENLFMSPHSQGRKHPV